jgi:hypothetical protein
VKMLLNILVAGRSIELRKEKKEGKEREMMGESPYEWCCAGNASMHHCWRYVACNVIGRC